MPFAIFISDQCCGSGSPSYEPGTNRMTSAYGWAIVNDANGNQTKTTIPNFCPGTPENQTWNARNQLTVYASGCLGYAATYTYDALGRRLSKTINGVTTKSDLQQGLWFYRFSELPPLRLMQNMGSIRSQTEVLSLIDQRNQGQNLRRLG
jgi:hypothetical protein